MRNASFDVTLAASLSLFSLTVFATADRAKAPTSGRQTEVRRIQIHFDSVLAELPTRDVSLLSQQQRANRTAALTTLAAYRDRGVFPRNYDFPDQPTPYFVDRKTGTLCAVAHLLEQTGRRDIVDRIAQQDNNVWVGELAGDRQVATWLERNGLTLEEAAFIQVPYAGDNSPVVNVLGGKNAAYGVGSAIVLGASGAASLYNAFANANGRGKLGTFLGATTGVLAMGFGAAAMSDEAAPPAVGAASLIVGGVSTFLSTRGYLRHRSYVAAQREAANKSLVARTSVSPIIPLNGTSGTGVAVTIRF